MGNPETAVFSKIIEVKTQPGHTRDPVAEDIHTLVSDCDVETGGGNIYKGDGIRYILNIQRHVETLLSVVVEGQNKPEHRCYTNENKEHQEIFQFPGVPES